MTMLARQHDPAKSQPSHEARFSGRVLHLVSGDLWGGAEAVVHSLVNAQHQARPGTVGCVVMNPGMLADKLIKDSIPTIVLDERHMGFKSLLKRVATHIDSFKPDVLHTHRRKENLLAFLYRGACTPSLVTTVHGMPEPLHRGSFLRRGLKDWFNQVVLRLGFDAVVAVSDDLAERLTNQYRPELVVRIHNGVPIANGVEKHQPARRSAPHLVALGRLVPIKRFDRLAELYAELMSSFATPSRIVLAGDGPLQSDLRALFDKHEAGIEMPGFVREPEQLLRYADALIVTSDHEGIPMSVLEALAMGVPVFGFAVGGLPEIAASNAPIFLAPPGDVTKLADRIREFFREHHFGYRAPPAPNWSFSIEECARRYDDTYLRLRSL